MPTFFTLICSFCKKEFLRDLKHINENKKLNQKLYCSLKCIANSKKQRIMISCENPTCGKFFERKKSQLSPHNFCSRSCAMTVNDRLFPKRTAVIKICNTCSKKFSGREKYCSKKCKDISQIKNEKYIINEIKSFYSQNGRIPLKAEFHHAKSARLRFGTWNNAIQAAGFSPNPVKFAKKHLANDGYTCDSVAEKNNMTVDFKINDIFIEYVGLQGVLKTYDNLIARKEKLWEEKNLKIIKIYPKDLFPTNKLHQILKFV